MGMSRALALVALLASGALSGEEVLGLPLHVERLNPAAVRVWVGDTLSSTAIVAFATSQGIVVVDTVGIPEVDARLRKVIARELGRQDFKVLIHTHEHSDHTFGNSVYADCTIVAHARCAEGMKANLADGPRVMAWLEENVGTLEKDLAKEPVASPKAKAMLENLTQNRLNLAAHKVGFKLVYPTKTFTDTLTLSMGDTTFELYYSGGLHTASDISVHVPRHGLLLTGDTMADAWFTDTPGCLASFTVRPGLVRDFPRLLKNWETLVGRQEQVKTLLPGHWNGGLSFKGFQQRVTYMRTLWEGIGRSLTEGKPMESLFRDFALRTRFPELVGATGITAQNHNGAIAGIYSEITHTTSAAQKLFELVGAHAQEKDVQQILDSRNRKPATHYFLEAEFNAFGYQLLQTQQPQQALRLFKAGAHLFPQSWNAHDSLGEAYLTLGDKAKAKAHYEKSLELNPGNTNGREILAKLAGNS